MLLFDTKKFRKERKLTQSEFSKLLGYQPSYISSIEKGNKPVSDNFLERIEQKFNIDLSQYKSWNQQANKDETPNTPDETIYWRNKYYELLERYNASLEEKEALRADFERKSKLVGKPLDKR